MTTFKRRSGVIFLAALTLILTQFACKTVTGDIKPTPTTISQVLVITPTPQVFIVTATPPAIPGADAAAALDGMSDDEISSGIQQALDLYAQAYTDNNPDLLEESVDQENKPFRRIVRSRFDEFQNSSQAGGNYDFQNTLLSIKRRDYGYVIAHFEDEGGWQADWPYRFNGERWVLSEPSVEQVGKPVTTEGAHFTFITYPWNDDVNQQIMDMMEKARQQVADKLGKVPTEKATVRIVPIYGIDPFGAMQAIAWYSAGGDVDGNDLIHIYAPNSFAYSYYDPSKGWDGQLQETLTHEYTHMAHRRSFALAGRLADWMSEGLAEYVAGAEGNLQAACHAYKNDTNIPILDQTDALEKQDLMHMTHLQKDTGLAYAFSHALTAFVIEKHGGLDGFWKLAKKIDESSDFKKALKLAFNMTYNDFNKEWESWLKEQCR